MGGAYVAKPVAAVTPEYPDDWDINWPWPGPPYPPGYEPEYAFTLSAPNAMVPGSVVSNVALTLTDREDYETKEPPETITWSATFKDSGAIVNLKFSGGSAYLAEVSQAYSAIGDFWGAEPEFEFEVSAGDVGEIIVLEASSNPFDYTTEKTTEIAVVSVMPRTAVFKVVMTAPSWAEPASPFQWRGYGTRMFFHNEDGLYSTPWALLYGMIFGTYDPPEWTYNEGAWTLDDFGVYVPVDDGSPWILGTCAVGTLQINALQLTSGITYKVEYRHEKTETDGGTVTFTYTLQVYEAGILLDTKTKEVVKSDGDPLGSLTTWCTIDGATGVITEL